MFQSTRPAYEIQVKEFQSTRPVRGATDDRLSNNPNQMFQSTRPVRGATVILGEYADIKPVSIHAPRAGRDIGDVRAVRNLVVSIHAPRAGRDEY